MTLKRNATLGMLLLLLAACGGGGGAAESADTTGADEASGQVTASRDYSAEKSALNAAEEPAAEAQAAGAGGGSAATGGDTANAVDVDAPKLEPLPDSSLEGQRIIKEGSITIEVPDGKFDAAFSEVVANARTLGGDVVGSSTRTTDEGDTFGSVTVRVPVEDFEDLLVDMGGIGTITHREINSEDVSTEFTDLESRLRHLEALERFYLGLFDDAKDVSEAITVQQKLADVQGQIEKAQGRLNLLDDRTSFSTLSVQIFEPGAESPVPKDTEPGEQRPSIARYWDTARDAFVNVVGAMLVALLFILPLLVPLAVVGALTLRYLRSRRPQPQVAAAEVEPAPDPVGADR